MLSDAGSFQGEFRGRTPTAARHLAYVYDQILRCPLVGLSSSIQPSVCLNHPNTQGGRGTALTTQLAIRRIKDRRRARRSHLFRHRNLQIKRHQPTSLYRRRHRQNRCKLARIAMGRTHAVELVARKSAIDHQSCVNGGLPNTLTKNLTCEKSKDARSSVRHRFYR